MQDEKEVREGLENALEDKPVASHGEPEQGQQAKEPEQTEKGKEASKAPGPIPYTRFKEVNDRVSHLQKALDTKESELKEQTKALANLSNVLESKERDVNYIQKIRELYHSGDETWAPVLEKLERRLEGIEEEVEAGDKTEKEGIAETKKLVNKVTAHLEDAILDQRADLIVARADTLAAEMLASLPEEYTDQDKKRIAYYLTEHVNWDEIESSQDWQNALEEELPRAFEYVLNDIYGEPEGVIAQRLREELEAKGQVKSPEPTAEERLEKITSRDWGKFSVSKSEKGRITGFNPEASDDEFSQALADAMRAGNEAARAAKR